MTDPAPVRLDFALQGERSHVRATDVLAAVLARWPGQPVQLRFLRPLAGPALLQPGARPGAAVLGRAGETAFALLPDTGAAASRAPSRQVPALWLALGGWHGFAFAPGTPLADRIAAIFDRVHPLQAERFVVRQIALDPGLAPRLPLIWFRLRIAPDRSAAELALRSPAGRLGRIEFRLFPRA
jgi:hypothetical protein